MKQTSETAFAPDWLALREPVDHAARDPGLMAKAAACVKSGGLILDLGSGTGSTARAFARAGHVGLRWRMLDSDPALLNIARAHHPTAECVIGDVANVDGLPLDGVSLITASALFDLMSQDWVSAVLHRAAVQGVPIYAALSYDGAMSWAPPDDCDRAVSAAFNLHQRRDKGTGPALGPDSGMRFAELARARGWRVDTAESPWHIGPEHAALHEMLIDGIAQAAEEAGTAEARRWGARRLDVVSGSRATVGHLDVMAVPSGRAH